VKGEARSGWPTMWTSAFGVGTCELAKNSSKRSVVPAQLAVTVTCSSPGAATASVPKYWMGRLVGKRGYCSTRLSKLVSHPLVLAMVTLVQGPVHPVVIVVC
jgi:hypothetical protein